MNWIPIHAGRNWRVFNTRTCQYHRGSNGAVRVYTTRQPAQHRADRLNNRGKIPSDPTANAIDYALTGAI